MVFAGIGPDPYKAHFVLANCQPITGKSTAWQIAGAIVFIAGALIIYWKINNDFQ